MADEALFLLLHNEMVSGVYKSAEQGEVVSAATYPGVLLGAPRDPAGFTVGSCGTHPGVLRDAPRVPAGCTRGPAGLFRSSPVSRPQMPIRLDRTGPPRDIPQPVSRLSAPSLSRIPFLFVSLVWGVRVSTVCSFECIPQIFL